MIENQRRLYGDLAWTWPIISSPEHYVEEAELFTRLVRKHSAIEARSLLHLGCGGGHLDLALKKQFRITGVDLSKQMLTLARRLNPDVEYKQGDMRTVLLRRQFDAAVIADSITYMLSERDLRNAFQTAWTHLKSGGVFCTYAEQTKERFNQNKTECSVRSQGDVQIVFIENTFDPNPADTTCEFTFVYLIRQDGKLQIETDRHLAGLFRLRTWIRLLKDTGFAVKKTMYPGEHIPVFVCKKPQ